MTDTPKTLALNARQWRVLLADQLSVLKTGVEQTENIDEDSLRVIYRHLDDMKMQATAWFQVSVVAPVAAPIASVVEQAAAMNGAIAPKKRGGWPKGKKRNAPARAVQ